MSAITPLSVTSGPMSVVPLSRAASTRVDESGAQNSMGLSWHGVRQMPNSSRLGGKHAGSGGVHAAPTLKIAEQMSKPCLMDNIETVL